MGWTSVRNTDSCHQFTAFMILRTGGDCCLHRLTDPRQALAFTASRPPTIASLTIAETIIDRVLARCSLLPLFI